MTVTYEDSAAFVGTKPAVIDPPEIWATLWEGFGTSEMVGSSSDRSSLCFDIGANCGQTIEQELELFDRVWAFEPSGESFSALAHYVANHRHKNRITAYRMAISDDQGEVALIEVPDKINTGQLVSSGAAGMEYDPADPQAVPRMVPCTSLDRIEGFPPSFLKIDVEGHELRVLMGARECIGMYRPDMLIEVHSEELGNDIRRLLRGFKYYIELVRHPHYHPFSTLYKSHFWIRAFH